MIGEAVRRIWIAPLSERVRVGVTIGALLVLAAACGPPMGPGGSPARFSPGGERIYFTGTDGSGDRIAYEGGPAGGMMMGALSCADCHGADGRGGRVQMMMTSFEAPDIRWSALTEDHGEAHGEEEPGAEHPPYTEASLRVAITEGIDPAGQPLDPLMPRWRLSEADLDDLVEFLKTLDDD